MKPESRQALRQMLLRDESFRQFPYSDTTGHLTIAIGRNLTDRGISLSEALFMLDDDISYFHDRLCHALGWFTGLDEPRQIALINMAFNLGMQGFLGFHGMLQMLERHDYARAADDMLKSEWSQQVRERATRLANIIRTGELN